MASSGETKKGAQGYPCKDRRAWDTGNSLALPLSGGQLQISKVGTHLDPTPGLLLPAPRSHGLTDLYGRKRLSGKSFTSQRSENRRRPQELEELQTGHTYLRDTH